jgi:hypothetical protein
VVWQDADGTDPERLRSCGDPLDGWGALKRSEVQRDRANAMNITRHEDGDSNGIP